MPELPEVETIKRDLTKLIVGKKVLDIKTDSVKQVQPSLGVVKKAVVGKRVLGIKRRAKLLIIELGNSSNKKRESLKAQKFAEDTEIFLAIHLKLTGRLLVRDKNDPQDDWQRVLITLSGGKELRFCDLRKFGWIKLLDARSWTLEAEKFGPEPFSKEFTINYLKKIFSKTTRAIKIVLMDQKKIAGIGNIYASEALFLAKIDPRKSAKQLGNQTIEQLKKSIITVLKEGIKYRGASDHDYLDALGQKGSYQDHFLVYGREGKKCFDCKGKVAKIKLGGRGTYFCPKCQK